MIGRPEGWAFERRPDRLLLSLANPGFTGRMWYFERLRPLERLGDLLVRQSSSWAASRLGAPSKPEPIITTEGEYGALVRLDGIFEKVPTSWSVGFIFGDDFYSCVEGRTSSVMSEHMHAVVRETMVSERHHLGVRRRRFLYRPPPWHGLEIGEAIAHYFPDEFPLIDVRISVFPAIPLPPGGHPLVDLQRVLGEHILDAQPAAAGGFSVTKDVEPEPFVAKAGLAGTRLRFRGSWNQRPPVVRDVLVLRDEGYAYAVELAAAESHYAKATEPFLHLASTIQAIPRSAGSLERLSAVSHWAD